MKYFLVTAFLISAFISSCTEKKAEAKNDFIIASGQMPAIAKDKENNLHLVYGWGDSIMYAYSNDNGNTFSQPSLIAVLPHVYTFATRGPQIAVTDKGLLVTACTSDGNIYSFYQTANNWVQGNKVTDTADVAKEGLMALSADGNNVFAVWLDVRGTNRNKIYGAGSNDGGRTWSENKLIYASPDSVVCECCKPSVIVWKNKVAVMFRNNLKGNRDLYLVQSDDNGKSFGEAKKLGEGSWKLDGCPMDGGSLTVNNNGEIQTVWRRESKIYAATPGNPEKEIGEGKGCTVSNVNNKDVYAWIENGKVILTTQEGEKKSIGNGIQPALQPVDNDHVLCVWEDAKQIHGAVVEL